MKKVLIATAVRGFWKDLFDYGDEEIDFLYSGESGYEVPKKWREFMALLVASRFFDFTGIFQIKKFDFSIESDYAFSYNRFLHSDRPYVIAVENPTALVNYSFKRMYHVITKIRLQKCFSDKNLLSIVCISKACEKTIKNYYDVPNTVSIKQIYPLVKIDDLDNPEGVIDGKHKDGILRCIYISAYFGLKGGMDVVHAFEKIKRKANVKLCVVTKVNTIDEINLNIIKNNPNIELIDYNLSKGELYDLYKKSNILLNPTRKDSFSLVTLEAIKHGCAVLSTDNYALKELVQDGLNGYKISPKFSYWDSDNMPNYSVVYNQKRTLDSNYLDNNVVDFIYEKLMFFLDNVDVLKEFETFSINYYNDNEFSNDYILNQWKALFM